METLYGNKFVVFICLSLTLPQLPFAPLPHHQSSINISADLVIIVKVFVCLFCFLVPYCKCLCYGHLTTATRRHISGDINQMEWCPVPPFPALLRLGNKDCKFETSLGCSARFIQRIIKFIESFCNFSIYYALHKIANVLCQSRFQNSRYNFAVK